MEKIMNRLKNKAISDHDSARRGPHTEKTIGKGKLFSNVRGVLERVLWELKTSRRIDLKEIWGKRKGRSLAARRSRKNVPGRSLIGTVDQKRTSRGDTQRGGVNGVDRPLDRKRILVGVVKSGHLKKEEKLAGVEFSLKKGG